MRVRAIFVISLQCPDSCGAVGRRHRDVQCVDSQSRRLLRPFHCQNVSSRPASSLTCPQKPCVTWSISPWGPVGAFYKIKSLFCNTFKRRTLLLYMYMYIEWKKQVAVMLLAVILSALAAVAKACGSGWSTAPRLIAVTPH